MRNEQLPQQTLPQQPQINEEYIKKVRALMNSKNAQHYLMELAEENPQFKQFMDIVQKGNGQQLYETLAHQYGVDPNWLLTKLLNYN